MSPAFDIPPELVDARESLLETLLAEGHPAHVVEALGRVPRHLFVPDGVRSFAYDNRALPLGDGQTISQPTVVASTSAALDIQPGDRVLEVGTGSGYQAAVLAELGAHVTSLERIPALSRRAAELLRSLGYGSVRCAIADGTCGVEGETFDKICVTAAAPAVPRPLRDALRPGGRLVAPIGSRQAQSLRLIEAGPTPDADRVTDLYRVVFVPLIGKHGWRG